MRRIGTVGPGLARRAGWLPLLLGALVAGCAMGNQPGQFTLLDGDSGGGPRVWPGPPDVPRYTYVGELLGEQNFRRPGSESQRGAARVFAWLVGLGQSDEEPLVLQRPQSGVTDERGRIYVTDVSRRAVYVFDTVAGRLSVWEDADGQERFVAPIGVTLGAGGQVLVTDAELGRVYRFSPDGQPLGSFGGEVLRRPTGIARDEARERIYVADTRGDDIKVFDDEGNLVGSIGEAGDVPGALNAPTYIAFAADRLYVTDTLNARVQVFDLEGRVVEVFGERGTYIGNLARPKGIAVDDEGNIYVVESYFDHLLVYDGQGRFLMPLGGTGQEAGQFYLPAGVWTDARDRIYVADMFNGRVSIFQFLGGS